VLWLGGLFVLQEAVDFRYIIYIHICQRLFDPLRQFAEKFTAIQAGFTAVEQVADILNEPIEIRDPDEAVSEEWRIVSGEAQAGEIRFEHVWFAYKDDDYVIKDLNFTIHPGEKVALVGPTGAGKSSIIRLLCRLYEPSRGRILLDGIDIRTYLSAVSYGCHSSGTHLPGM